MAEIDRLRIWADAALADLRACPCRQHREHLRYFRDRVEAALREWWAQDCRESGGAPSGEVHLDDGQGWRREGLAR